jgi:hypothetical protein
MIMLNKSQQKEIMEGLVQVIYIETGIELNQDAVSMEVFSDKIIVSVWNHFYSLCYYKDYDYDAEVLANELFQKSVDDIFSNIVNFRVMEMRKFISPMSELIRSRLMREGMDRTAARNLSYSIEIGDDKMKRTVPDEEGPKSWGYPDIFLWVTDFDKFDFMYSLNPQEAEKPYNSKELSDKVVEYFSTYKSTE